MSLDLNDELNRLHQQLAKKPGGRKRMWDHLNDPPGPVDLDGDKKVVEHARKTAAFIDELNERIRMLNDIALSAIALKIRIEHGFPPVLYALNRDLNAYQRRFGGWHEETKKS